MNFSPAWILAVLHQTTPDCDPDYVQICHLLTLFDLINLKFNKSEAISIF